MKRITLFLPLFLLAIGSVSAEEPEEKSLPAAEPAPKEKIFEMTLQQGLLEKMIAEQNRDAHPGLVEYHEAPLDLDADESEIDEDLSNQLESDVKKIFDTLY